MLLFWFFVYEMVRFLKNLNKFRIKYDLPLYPVAELEAAAARDVWLKLELAVYTRCGVVWSLGCNLCIYEGEEATCVIVVVRGIICVLICGIPTGCTEGSLEGSAWRTTGTVRRKVPIGTAALKAGLYVNWGLTAGGLYTATFFCWVLIAFCTFFLFILRRCCCCCRACCSCCFRWRAAARISAARFKASSCSFFSRSRALSRSTRSWYWRISQSSNLACQK